MDVDIKKRECDPPKRTINWWIRGTHCTTIQRPQHRGVRVCIPGRIINVVDCVLTRFDSVAESNSGDNELRPQQILENTSFVSQLLLQPVHTTRKISRSIQGDLAGLETITTVHTIKSINDSPWKGNRSIAVGASKQRADCQIFAFKKAAHRMRSTQITKEPVLDDPT